MKNHPGRWIKREAGNGSGEKTSMAVGLAESGKVTGGERRAGR